MTGAANLDLQAQIDYLERSLEKSFTASQILTWAPHLELPGWYLGAGAVCQVVWNRLHGRPIELGIKDFDLVYYDPDISDDAKASVEDRAAELFANLPVQVELKNQARMHLKHLPGRPAEQYASTEAAINTWPTTASSVGVRYERNRFVVYAPYGLNDMMAMVVRPNRTLITREIYELKAARWARTWPRLTILPWDAS